MKNWSYGEKFVKYSSYWKLYEELMREKCPNQGLFLVAIYPYLESVRRFTLYSLQIPGNADNRKFRVRTISTLWIRCSNSKVLKSDYFLVGGPWKIPARVFGKKHSSNTVNNYRYTNADLKISLYVCVHIKLIPWKFRFLNPKNSRGICS